MSRILNRRTFIVAGALGAGGVLYGVPVSRGLASECYGWKPEENESLSGLRRVGETWLKESSDRELAVKREFESHLREIEQLHGDGDAILAIKQDIKADFENGRVDKCDGWVLSNTELRLCAVLFLNDKFVDWVT